MSTACDVAIIGSGFAGSLLGWILQRIGLRVTLIERGTHPRFAIGESSSPVANLILGQLAADHDLPQLGALSKYGSWQAAHSDLACGLKRGFSYFHHEVGRALRPLPGNADALLVGASPSDDDADTHWYRADFDAWLVEQAAAAGVTYLPSTECKSFERQGGDGWLIHCLNERSATVTLRAQFVVDATGGSDIARLLESETCHCTAELHTHSRALFAHFADVRPWSEVYPEFGGTLNDHPFNCDDAALHHVFDGGWMWVLRFNNGHTSAGFVLQDSAPTHAPNVEWRQLLRRFPAIGEQFRDARVISAGGSCVRTGRLQRLITPCAGSGYALLPAAGSFVDPFFSTGNAHNLCGVARLVDVIRHTWEDPPAMEQALSDYERLMVREVCMIDGLVDGCGRSFGCFPWMTAYSMCYFAAATSDEHRRRSARHSPWNAYLCADDDGLVDLIATFRERLMRGLRFDDPPEHDPAFVADLFQHLQPYNHVGLCDPVKHNMYPYV